MSRLLGIFFERNTKLSQLFEKKFNWRNDKYFWVQFDSNVRQALLSLAPGSRVADLGGGRRFLYRQAVPDQVEIWSIDIDQNELDLNQDVQIKICGDISKTLPIDENFFDLIISRALLEHVADNESAFQEMRRILKPNGTMVHLIPARNSTFGIAARIFPFEKLKNLLHVSVPDAKGQVEFPIFYNKCTPKQMKNLLNELGFRKVQIDVCYYASGYFYSVFPLYLFISLYQYIIRRSNLRFLSQYMIVRLSK